MIGWRSSYPTRRPSDFNLADTSNAELVYHLKLLLDTGLIDDETTILGVGFTVIVSCS